MKIDRVKNRLASTIIVIDKTCFDALSQIEKNGLKTLIVTDSSGGFRGVITDGDIRRAFLGGVCKEDSLTKMMNSDPITVQPQSDENEILSLMRKYSIEQIPVVERETRQPWGLWLRKDFFVENTSGDVPVLLMAGGKGSRLGELTAHTPKPMLQLGNKPILEHLVCYFKSYGFRRFFISTQHLADKIRDYFGDGRRLDVEIRYLHEEVPLGTAGALQGLSKIDFDQCIVSNADVITNLDLNSLLKHQMVTQSAMTLAVKEHAIKVPYGVVEVGDEQIFQGLSEKPRFQYFLNTGIYVCTKEAVRLISPGEKIDMPELIHRVQSRSMKVSCFCLLEDWMDIGLPEEYAKASEKFRHQS